MIRTVGRALASGVVANAIVVLRAQRACHHRHQINAISDSNRRAIRVGIEYAVEGGRPGKVRTEAFSGGGAREAEGSGVARRACTTIRTQSRQASESAACLQRERPDAATTRNHGKAHQRSQCLPATTKRAAAGARRSPRPGAGTTAERKAARQRRPMAAGPALPPQPAQHDDGNQPRLN